jgi:(E)-4-hydroxy-3-methylbut-2-enyl-diphosphate synthase
MTKTHTTDVDATLGQIGQLAEVGCEIVRCAVPSRAAVSAFRRVAQRSPLPVVADIHFDHHLALMALEAGADGVRINPGNMRDQEGLKKFYRAAASAGVKVRVGVNSGSIRPRKGLEVEHGDEDLAGLMVREAMDYCRAAEREGLRSIVLSLKASDAPTTIAAYRRAARLCDYPFHLGVTAAGPPAASIVKSAIGIGALLAEGIGDTIRVSMTGPPQEEVKAGLAILEALGLREPDGPRIVSCPTCARCEIDVRGLVDEVARRVEGMDERVTVAVMGCVVNGPGEAAEADVGIAGGRDFGYLFREGRKLRKVPAAELADALVEEIERMRTTPDGRRQ